MTILTLLWHHNLESYPEHDAMHRAVLGLKSILRIGQHTSSSLRLLPASALRQSSWLSRSGTMSACTAWPTMMSRALLMGAIARLRVSRARMLPAKPHLHARTLVSMRSRVECHAKHLHSNVCRRLSVQYGTTSWCPNRL